MLIYIVLLALISLTIIVQSKKSLHMLQQNLYNENNRYLKWVAKNYKEYFNILIIAIILTIIGAFIAYDLDRVLYFLSILLIGCFSFECYQLSKILENDQVKKPLVITKRVKRLIITTTILYLIPIVVLFYKKDQTEIIWYMLLVLVVMSYFNHFIVLLSNMINFPYERGVYYYYKNKAKSTLKNRNNLRVIGITGSYGKTSSKNILSDILNIKYNALPTPRNLNTPNGLMITINNHLDKFTEIFIAEMGAYVRGEIKELCDLVHPKYGILTRIGTAHLESFGSEENIQRAKFELIESLPSDGIGVLNGDDEKQVDYQLQNPVEIIWVGIDNQNVDVRAMDIKSNHKGTNFKVKFKDDKEKYEFQTKLLGKHNVYNILAAIALGRKFGISISELQQAVRGVKAVEHRLELKKLGSFYQIDGAYNSNPVGAKSAVEVLGMMPGIKVVVTPGMIELGKMEEKYNKELGSQIAGVADYAVLIGEQHTKPIYEGLIENGFDKENIIVYNDVRTSYEFINQLASQNKKDVYALFENDLPDTYNE
ncbi:MAG: UDP-N-acetylmuramoyl-tripeptide--D-alanyl-D-alanine ligase [Bacilli bacterium]|nr:UDP-N-acetylmuramoyl-tripeptide--D-alanyl-D-alanine ligase [Bacilli bacterium]